MLAADLRMPQYGLSGISHSGRSGHLGGIFSKISKSISGAFESLSDEAKRTWDRVRAEARRSGNRVGDALETAVRDLGAREWWVDNVARRVSSVLASKTLVAIASFVYPPIALVAVAIGAFLSRWDADVVGTAEFWSVADRDGMNEFLAGVVVEMNKVDLLQLLPTLVVTELAVQAQESSDRRDALRLKVGEIQARWAQTEWAVIAKHAYQAAQAIVIGVVTFGAGTVLIAGVEIAINAIVALGQQLISAATTALQMQQMRELVKIAKDQQRERRAAEEVALAAEMRALEEEIARVNAEIEAMGGAPVGGGTVAEALEVEGAPVAPRFGVSPVVLGAALLAGGALAYAASGAQRRKS